MLRGPQRRVATADPGGRRRRRRRPLGGERATWTNDDYFERIDDAIARGLADRREVDEARLAATLRRLVDEHPDQGPIARVRAAGGGLSRRRLEDFSLRL